MSNKITLIVFAFITIFVIIYIALLSTEYQKHPIESRKNKDELDELRRELFYSTKELHKMEEEYNNLLIKTK